jgi:hypothetical protein
MPDSDEMLAQGTVDFRNEERRAANSGGWAPAMERVRLHGGPLDGKQRHVERYAGQAWFKAELSDRKYLYRRDTLGVWRYDGGART